MIRAAGTEAQKQQIRRCIRPYPALRTMLGQDLALWGDNPGAPVRFFALDGAALALYGKNAWLCGCPAPPDGWQELYSFLRFAGVERLRTVEPAPAAWPGEMPILCYGLQPGSRLSLPPQPTQARLDRQPPVGEIAGFLFAEAPARRDDFYAATCPAVARGLARLWALRDGSGQILTAVGACALHEGGAYMAMGQTRPADRGRGLGGWLIPALANALAAEGRQVTLLCKPNRMHFYERLGFDRQAEYKQYKIDAIIQ